jgi:hypothetical protein
MRCYFLFRFNAFFMNGYSLGVTQKIGKLALIATLALLTVGGVRIIEKNRSQNIALVPLTLDSSNPRRNTVGALTFLNAWELRSDNSDFGGISGLVALKDGRFVGVSDAGALIGFGLTNDERTDRPFIAALPGAMGKDVSYRDSEGITYDPNSDRIWVSYEARHAIRRFPPSLSRIDSARMLEFSTDWKFNGGVEALARLNDGQFVIFVESGENDDVSKKAYLFSGDPTEKGTQTTPFHYRVPDGYSPTDATVLPDGRLLVLNRRVGFPDGFTAKLLILDPADIRRGAVVGGKVIATLAPPLLVDNMEGVTITEDDGQTIVWLISDNNFNAFQRTLLMKFRLNLNNKKPETNRAPGFDSL